MLALGARSALASVPPTIQQSGAPTSAGAADSGSTTGPRHVFGRVVHPVGRALVPLADHWVILHRVGSDTAGPIDSTHTRANGEYTFTYREHGARDAVYLVSATYEGIAYLSQPLTEAVVRGAAAEITVYDTTSRMIPMHMRGRHLVVSAPAPTGLRSVVEVFELSNDTSVTAVSPTGSDHPTWSVALPSGAQRFQVGQGDVAPDAVAVQGVRAGVFAPIAPGLKQMSFSYALPGDAFPLTRRLTEGAIVLEVLLEEPRASISGVALRQVAPVTIEGRTFRRFLGQDVPPNATLRVSVPTVLANQRQLYIAVVVIVLGAAMLGGLALAFQRSTGSPLLAGVRRPV